MIQQGATYTGEKWRDHYQTPEYILEAVKKVLGESYFDPCPKNPDFNGLEVEWHDPAFINPPFSEYEAWVDYGLTQKGSQIWIANTNNATGWWKKLVSSQTLGALCLLSERVKFIDPRTGDPATQPATHSCLYYRGVRPDLFRDVFSELGIIALVMGDKL